MLEKCVDTKSLIQAVKKSVKTLPQDYYKTFAETYELDAEKVEKSFSYIYNMSDIKLKQSIENYIYKLRTLLKSEDQNAS